MGCDIMDEKNIGSKSSNNNSDDLFESFNKENSDIDGLLEDAFAFMNADYEDEAAEKQETRLVQYLHVPRGNIHIDLQHMEMK